MTGPGYAVMCSTHTHTHTHQTVIIGPGLRKGIRGQRSATLAYNSRSRVPDQKRVEIGVLTPMARIDGRMGTERDNERCNDSVKEVDGIEVGSRKRKRRDSVSPLSRLIRSSRRSSNH